ncbi:hypothetical protein Prum_022450 [Phytohabitans rumicis]|uniref:Uncharacterized protein n=1 Tax=Phytohabitans rumicis TaxID=1076125 RepID=A0A6V8KU31_9ACTN|nr:hypothetical protein Prum_022450 [Phytohabitans rumicis]
MLDTTGYLLLAAEVDGHSGPPSEAKRRLVADLKGRASQLRRDMFANVLIFTACHLRADPGLLPRYDVGVLIQAPTVESAHWLKGDPAFAALYQRVHEPARSTRVVVTYNARRNACEYGPRLPRIYVLMRYVLGDEREVVPGWGWTYRRHLWTDLLLNRELHRYLRPGGQTAPAQSIMYRLA